MNDKIRRRIEALEAGLMTEPLSLRMPGESIKTINGSERHLQELYAAMISNELTPAQEWEIGLIDQSVRSREPRGGRMIELFKGFLDGPVGEPPPGWTPHPQGAVSKFRDIRSRLEARVANDIPST